MTEKKDIFALNINKGNELVPIGTVVIVDFVEQAVMIYGRKQQQEDKNEIWDYVACPYPQGHLSDETNIFFNHDQIQQIIFKGFETEGEVTLRQEILEKGGH
ncbi:MAG TPA: DUF4176 domain-containing protein [Pseudogracilibacillus sp.]|nr:DUF4176 domain-containing protein [Pseudogracilibacillus sp.]